MTYFVSFLIFFFALRCVVFTGDEWSRRGEISYYKDVTRVRIYTSIDLFVWTYRHREQTRPAEYGGGARKFIRDRNHNT